MPTQQTEFKHLKNIIIKIADEYNFDVLGFYSHNLNWLLHIKKRESGQEFEIPFDTFQIHYEFGMKLLTYLSDQIKEKHKMIATNRSANLKI